MRPERIAPPDHRALEAQRLALLRALWQGYDGEGRAIG